MKYYESYGNRYIEIRPEVLKQIHQQAESEYPNENGGMLAGHYSEDRHTVYIERVVSPMRKTMRRDSFERAAKGLEEEWKELSAQGLRYVGEWHSHPNGSTQYSSTDLEAMAKIEREVSIANPLLLIISLGTEGVRSHTFYCYGRNNELLKYKSMIDLRDLFRGLQEEMLSCLRVTRGFINHPGSKGDATEQQWINFLKTYLPNKYLVDKAIVIDSTGDVSDQMDIVIYDALYTPFIFNRDGFKYIPAESVYAVFEVKQDLKGHIEYAAKKVESVRKLKRTSIDMVASGRHTPAAPLTKIIGGILTTTSTYVDSETIREHLKSLRGYQTLDLGCMCDSGSFYVDYTEEESTNPNTAHDIEQKRRNIEQVYTNRKAQEIRFSNKDVSLFTFFLQLVSYLKSIGTVPAIDINAYLEAIGERIDKEN